MPFHTDRETVVLVTRDPVLVSSLSARMTISGEELITLPDLVSQSLSKEIVADATIIVDAALLPREPEHWEPELRGQGWQGALIVLVDKVEASMRRRPGVMVVEKSGGSSAVLAVLAMRRARPRQP